MTKGGTDDGAARLPPWPLVESRGPTATQNSQAGASRPQRRRTQKLQRPRHLLFSVEGCFGDHPHGPLRHGIQNPECELIGRKRLTGPDPISTRMDLEPGPLEKGERPRETTASRRPFPFKSRLVARPTVPSLGRSARSGVSGRFRSHPRFWMHGEAVLPVLCVPAVIAVAVLLHPSALRAPARLRILRRCWNCASDCT